ncbi:uncharacterized protein LAESUDRAFT_660929 [Laetiporus sulphureus 93-53]|uniref:Uncharacterized protein n=1 Tax=Laetiporus sulphureus 93-53 TaxID=1314785 RepID=A0A165CHR1_9APHY|nr:uncharacterized protein LAESUDRAFT_660929 [Laetiporus sulphureus 93-53]KZT02838.1 hypothetical protein LAESUDRAFT_660929 [Laetiporus sulphureus 93-53]
MPVYQYSHLAMKYLQSPQTQEDPAQKQLMRELSHACRAYSRVVLRLRAQAETEAKFAPVVGMADRSPNAGSSEGRTGGMFSRYGSVTSLQRGVSRTSSRAASPSSSWSHIPGQHSRHVSGQSPHGFRSPLFRLRRAPLLQVFVPSPEGNWLSDTSVVACENELKRAGVQHLLRPGDVVWDVAVGDEGNVGRMVWDGAYLIDLDYTWSRIGDLPHYLPTLAFPPSYFHRVIRTTGSGNPICHIDISPWGDEIAANLQLLQDRAKTETDLHPVVRWVHRSSFTIAHAAPGKLIRIAVPSSAPPGPNAGGSWLIDPAWYGTVVVEAEGTNEGLADLQARCGRAFPPRAIGASATGEKEKEEKSSKNVFRILREKNRPEEIWIRTVRDKERLL